MSFQVSLNSRNVLVPLSLESLAGERMNGALSRLDTATALVIQVSATGGFTQEFVPLKISQDAARAYSGEAWELWVQKAAGDIFSYYLGVPDRFFAEDAEGNPPRSLSVQVVGTSPLTGREEFSGGVDVTLQAQVEPPLIPGFLNLGERFFPTLLPHNFIERHSVDVFEFGGKRRLLLLAAVQIDPSDRVPVSLEKHWDTKGWLQAAVQNLAAAPKGNAPGYYAIRGGCFYGRNRKITHWFGGDIGLEEKGFREAATDKIRAMGQSGNGAWVFWLDPQDGAPGPEAFGDPAAAATRPIAIRHPMLHRLLGRRASARVDSKPAIAHLPAEEAVAALAQVARALTAHQEILLRFLAEPNHDLWSERPNTVKEALLAMERRGSEAPMPEDALIADIRALYRARGETLRLLETEFDETFGYSAWDAVGNPLRDVIAEYLAASEAATEARSPA